MNKQEKITLSKISLKDSISFRTERFVLFDKNGLLVSFIRFECLSLSNSLNEITVLNVSLLFNEKLGSKNIYKVS